MGNWRMAVLALAFAAGMQVAVGAAPTGDALAKIQRAGQLSGMADSNASSGNRGIAISLNRKALKLLDEAVALGANPAEIEQGRRMVQLDTAEWLPAERKWNQALELFRDAATVRRGGFPAYVRVRALKGIIGAEAGPGNKDAVRGVLAERVRTAPSFPG